MYVKTGTVWQNISKCPGAPYLDQPKGTTCRHRCLCKTKIKISYPLILTENRYSSAFFYRNLLSNSISYFIRMAQFHFSGMNKTNHIHSWFILRNKYYISIQLHLMHLIVVSRFSIKSQNQFLMSGISRFVKKNWPYAGQRGMHLKTICISDIPSIYVYIYILG